MDQILAILISLFHDLFAAVWIGGIVVYYTVITLSIKNKVDDPEKSQVFRSKVNDNFGFILFLIITLVLGTGIMFEDGISFFLGEGAYSEVLGLKVLAMMALIILIIPSLAVENLHRRLVFGILHTIVATYVIYLSLELKYIRYGLAYHSDTYFWAIIHDLFTFIWIGGMIAYLFTILITARSVFTKVGERKILMLAIRKNMAILALTSMVLLTTSGIFILPLGEIWPYFFSNATRYSAIFYRKLVTSILLFIMAGIKIFRVDRIKIPKIKRRWILTIATINILLAGLITYLSILMRYVRYI